MEQCTLTSLLLQRRERRERQEYKVKYLGSVLCSHPGVEEICRAMAEMYAQNHDRIKQLTWSDLEISAEGITLENIPDRHSDSNGLSSKWFRISKIVYCGVDNKHQKVFAFFYCSPDNVYGALDCHVIKCRSRRNAKSIALTLSEIFHEIPAQMQESVNSSYHSVTTGKTHDRTESVVQLHTSSLHSLTIDDEQHKASPQTNFASKERKLGDSELQINSTKYQNDSSGYGDSSDDLLHGAVTKRENYQVQVMHIEDSLAEQAGQVTRQYVNEDVATLPEQNQHQVLHKVAKPFALTHDVF